MLPGSLHTLVRRQNLRNAEEFLAYVDTFRTSLAQELGWTQEELIAARRRLAKLLKDHVADNVLKQVRRRQRRLGALRPA